MTEITIFLHSDLDVNTTWSFWHGLVWFILFFFFSLLCCHVIGRIDNCMDVQVYRFQIKLVVSVNWNWVDYKFLGHRSWGTGSYKRYQTAYRQMLINQLFVPPQPAEYCPGFGRPCGSAGKPWEEAAGTGETYRDLLHFGSRGLSPLPPALWWGSLPSWGAWATPFWPLTPVWPFVSITNPVHSHCPSLS